MTQRMEDLLAASEACLEAPDDPEAALDYCTEHRLGDGLPIIPPTPERVERMLHYWPGSWDEGLGPFAPREGEVTALRVAANAVMAGCRPEYFPLVMLILEAIRDPAFNLKGVQATTHPCTPFVVVNGPIGRELGVNAGCNAFGPGCRANATIGRAVRLAMINIGGAIPGVVDMATLGTPGKYTFVVAENEAESPWEPLHVERGFDAAATTVTVLGCEGPLNINDHFSKDGAGVLTTMAGTMANVGNNNIFYASEAVLAVGPEHAQTVAASGFSKADAKRFLQEKAQIPLSRFSPDNVQERFRKWHPERYGQAAADTLVPVVQDPEHLLLVVVGGAGKHSMFLPSFGATRVVTRPLRLPDGRLARSIGEFAA